MLPQKKEDTLLKQSNLAPVSPGSPGSQQWKTNLDPTLSGFVSSCDALMSFTRKVDKMTHFNKKRYTGLHVP
jgi:hypothetical protein